MYGVLTVCCHYVTGIEDGQTVKVPVGKKYIYITFRVSVAFQIEPLMPEFL